MSRSTWPAVAAVAAASGLLAGCGVNARAVVSGSETRRPEVSATTPASRPTGPPWPAYPADDYSYGLVVVCFCIFRGVPVTVTVHDGEVTDAVYARPARGHAAGDQVSERWLRLTINDIIDAANDTASAQVKVHWPRGQAYPSSVWIDRIKDAADDEVRFSIRHVKPTARTAPRLP